MVFKGILSTIYGIMLGWFGMNIILSGELYLIPVLILFLIIVIVLWKQDEDSQSNDKEKRT